MRNKIALGIVLLFAIAQLFQIERVERLEVGETDILISEGAEAEVQTILKRSCYDCHSNQVSYPWYSSISPLSFWIQDHIDHGREHLNFSEWGSYSAKKKAHKAEEMLEEVEEEEMPLGSYLIVHRDAVLSDEDQEILLAWFQSLESKYQE